MGSICSCLCVEGFGEYMHSDASIYRQCICVRCFAQWFVHVYTVLIQREDVNVVPISLQGTTSLVAVAPIADNSISDTYHSPPRPLPYDDPRCSRLQRDTLVSRRDKSSSHFHEESEPLRSTNDNNLTSMTTVEKWNGSSYEGGSKLCCSDSLSKPSLGKVATGIISTFSSSEDDDVCPTCLEEYTCENPRIIMQCSHHFHLGCIYEWMERSEFCPVCGKVMVFNETK